MNGHICVAISGREGYKIVRRSIFDQIFKEMINIRLRLDDIENSISGWKPAPLEVAETKLINLPDHLRQTFLIVASKGECSAIEVSNLTARCRAIESNYLNQLSRMGWLNKRRVSKTTLFRPISETNPRDPLSMHTKAMSMKGPARSYKFSQKV